MMNVCIGLDFETYSAVDLNKHGLDRYINHPTFRPLLANTVRRSQRGPLEKRSFDFVLSDYAWNELLHVVENPEGVTIAGHNVGFEEAVLRWMGADLSKVIFVDTAVVARRRGGASKLAAAAPQLLDVSKLDIGDSLIKLFSVPGKFQAEDQMFNPDIVAAHPKEWADFDRYCGVDAELSLLLAQMDETTRLGTREQDYFALTQRMNDRGWKVDLDLVREMQRQYERNKLEALDEFHDLHSVPGEPPLNFNSFPQMKKWCEVRGIKAKSFDEQHVQDMLEKITAKLNTGTLPATLRGQYEDVHDFLVTKQILGGSSLSKLQTILDQTGDDGRLRNQYLHLGAGQTYRTSGRGVQMQNLKRLGSEPADMDDLSHHRWDNTRLAENLRQVFTASDPAGLLFVGDFASVESRGLAWLAGEDWKIDAYRDGKDMYRVLAAKIFGTDYDLIVKDQRQLGKVGELSCGYQASGPAVQAFAAKMGTELSEGEASRLVFDWRQANPKIEALWESLDDMLRQVVLNRLAVYKPIGNDLWVVASPVSSPRSLERQVIGNTTVTVRFSLHHQTSTSPAILERVFVGCHVRGRSICYYKPSSKKSGDLWTNNYQDPKTKQRKFYSVYGGKIAGILTQSFCRELFFLAMQELDRRLEPIRNVQLVGQFHDELVVDWVPPKQTPAKPYQLLTASMLTYNMEAAMTSVPPWAVGFPLAVDIKRAYRYIK